MLLRWDPFREFDREWDRLTGSLRGGRSYLPMDAYRQGDQFVIHFDLPGVDPDSVDLTVEKDVLTVTAERSWRAEETQQVLVSERPQGRFTRQVLLGDVLDADHVEARYDQGVLTVTIPVAEQAKPRKVAINAGGAAEPKAIDATASAA